jgi:hypothetical protein
MDSTVAKLSDEHVVLFFRKLKTELNCSSTGKTIAQVRRILSKIKGIYTVREVTEIFNQTPPLLHFLLIGNCRYEEDNKRVTHLDELVDTLYTEDQQQVGKKRLFKSEIEALGTVLIVLKRLQSLFKEAGMKVFPYVLSNELQQAVIEEAA